MKMDEKSAHNVIDDDVCAFLPLDLISTSYTSSYHFSSYLHIIFSKAVGALRYSSSFSIQNAKCIFDVVPPFHVLCDGPFLHGQTVAISKSPYYIWKRYNKTWRLLVYCGDMRLKGKKARYLLEPLLYLTNVKDMVKSDSYLYIWLWDEFEWCAKKMLWGKFFFNKFLRTHQLGLP